MNGESTVPIAGFVLLFAGVVLKLIAWSYKALEAIDGIGNILLGIGVVILVLYVAYKWYSDTF
jgi:hypothetical protein